MQPRAVLLFLSWFGCTNVVLADTQFCQKALMATPQGLVSKQLLWRIARVESGRGYLSQPWPWTINVRGVGYYFKTKQIAVQYIKRLMLSGIRSFDIGCWQINARWHGHKVRDIVSLLDPHINAQVAQSYLQSLVVQHRHVGLAVASYHSPNNYTRGYRYVQKVLALR